jgi:Spy/CpxP family protein refolding chaperone
MQSAFAIVLFVVVGVAAVAAVWALVTSGGSYDQIGRSGMSIGEDRPAPTEAAAAREAEIRQMLEARNARRAARGEAPQDVDAEVRALTSADPELRDEVRAMVEARNARRAARGEEPLDVEAEIDRRLRELGA